MRKIVGYTDYQQCVYSLVDFYRFCAEFEHCDDGIAFHGGV